MKFSVLVTLLALCLLAFATNVSSKSIEVDSAEDSVELSESTAATEPAEETTESPSEDSTVAPDNADPIVVNIDEVRKYVKDVMSMVEKMMISVVDALSQDKIEENGPIRHPAGNIVGVH